MSIRLTYQDKEYEFRGEYSASLKKGDHFLDIFGDVLEVTEDAGWASHRAIVHPVPVRHTFGGVVWEEGEARYIKAGGVSLEAGQLQIWYADSTNKHIPLTPLEVINGQDN